MKTKINSVIIFLSVIIIVNPANDYNINKSSSVLEHNKIEYKIEYYKNNLNRTGNPIIEDSISNNVSLNSIKYPLPSKYKLRNQNRVFDGYPPKGDFDNVSSLYWTYNNFERNRFNQLNPYFDYSFNCNFRIDLNYFPESMINNILPASSQSKFPYMALGNVHSAIEKVDDDLRLFTGTIDGKLLSMDPKKRIKLWEYSFPLGEGINTPLASFKRKVSPLITRTYIVLLTEAKNVYLFDGKEGGIIWKKSLNSLTFDEKTRIKIYEFDSKIYILINSINQIIMLDSDKGDELISYNLNSYIISSFFIQLGNIPAILIALKNGNISCISLKNEFLWNQKLKGEIEFDGSATVIDCIPYLVYGTNSNSVYVLNGFNGEIILNQGLPGRPCSDISLDPEQLTYFLLVDLVISGKKSLEESIFYSANIFNNNIDKMNLKINGTHFAGPYGVKISKETIIYFMNENNEFYAVKKNDRMPLKGYPVRFNAIIQKSKSLYNGYMSLIDGAIFITKPDIGVLILGVPRNDDIYNYLSWASPLSGEDFQSDSMHLTSSRYRNDLQSQPSNNFNFSINAGINPKDNYSNIITPVVYWSKYYKRIEIAISTNAGNLLINDQNGRELKRYIFNQGGLFTEPIIEENSDIRRLYLITENSLLAINENLTNGRLSTIWERKDLGSFGTSFCKIKNNLLFVDKLLYLTCINIDKGETIFREKVDSKYFAIGTVNSQNIVFCGSKGIIIESGRVLYDKFIPSSDSTINGFLGKTLLFQSDDTDMYCFDAENREIIWRVRKLLCKDYCFKYSAPALYRKGSNGFAYWTDYKRIVCIDLNTGLIRWRYNSDNDFFLSKPTIIETENSVVVYAGSINGRIYAFDAFNGYIRSNYPINLPGLSRNDKNIKGASSPVIVNGMMLITRIDYGVISYGRIVETNKEISSLVFNVIRKLNMMSKKIFNRAIIYWDNSSKKSNIVKN